MSRKEILQQKLNAPSKTERLDALRELMSLYESGELERPTPTHYVNNHVHTTYSFSPYSPTSAVYTAWISGLSTVGIMDHDSISGAKEFIEAGKIVPISITCGMETRVSIEGTPFYNFRMNNPDQTTVCYVAAHGVPHQSIDALDSWIAPYRANREKRNRKMVENINAILGGDGISLDYDGDVRPISMAEDGGSVTERHILYALSYKITAKFGKGQKVIDFLSDKLNIQVSGKNHEVLESTDNTMYEYYLLGVLKGNFVERFYIPATDECPPIKEFVRFVTSIGGIPAYPYLGDVGDSITGDKKTQTFEDGYLDDLIPWIKGAGFTGLTFMPTRNTLAQLTRLMNLGKANGLFQISGEDINTPFQSFICIALDKKEFSHLINASWALIGHENAATERLESGMFSTETIARIPSLEERITYFSEKGKADTIPTPVTPPLI